MVVAVIVVVESLSLIQLFCDPPGRQSARFLCPWDFLGKNTGVGCHFFLQVLFPTQGLNSHLLHRQGASLPLSHQRSPN